MPDISLCYMTHCWRAQNSCFINAPQFESDVSLWWGSGYAFPARILGECCPVPLSTYYLETHAVNLLHTGQVNFDLFHYGGLCCFSFFKLVILPLLIEVCHMGIYFEIMWIPCYSSNFHPLAFSTYQWFLLESIIFMVVGDLILSLLLHLLVGIFLWGRAFPSSRSYISTELQILCSVVHNSSLTLFLLMLRLSQVAELDTAERLSMYIPDLAYEIPFRLAPGSFWHILLFFEHFLYFKANQDVPASSRLFWLGPRISHFSSELFFFLVEGGV